MINLGSHFSHVDKRRSELAHQRKWFIKAKQDHQKREDHADKLEDDLTAFVVEAITATEIQIREFEVKLDKYDAAVVTALMENQKQLDIVNAEIEEILSQAYVMEDGRRVFKTEDGTQVFDEFDQFVSREELDYDLIGPERPTLESYRQKIYSRDGLEAKREELLTVQKKLDETRERVSEGGHTQEDLEEMDAELQDLLPDDVKTHVTGVETPTATKDLTSADKKSDVTQSTSPSVSVPVPI